MGEPGMVLREEDVRRISDYVRPWLRDLVNEIGHPRAADVSVQLLERMVRVEEELKAQRELFAERFGVMQWTMMVGFTIITVAVTAFGLLA